MEKKQFHRRGLGMLLLAGRHSVRAGSSLYDAQMIHGAEYLARSQNSIAETQTVEAARGDILDRYGRVLVSNRVTYQVALNTDAMEKNRNDILLALIRIARDAGVEWEDTLPITAQPPFRYTTDTPFQYPTTDEEGSPTTSLTRLGRLAVKMKWIDDPTADGPRGAPLPTAGGTAGKNAGELSAGVGGRGYARRGRSTVRAVLPLHGEQLASLCLCGGRRHRLHL